MTWQDRAACRDDPHPEAWFPDNRHHDRERAVRVCMGCPVRSECLADELAILDTTGDEPRGVRAGLDADERRTVNA